MFVRTFYNILQKNLWPTFWPTHHQAVWRGNSVWPEERLFHSHCDKAKFALRHNKSFHTVLVWFANETRTQWDKMTQELASSPVWPGPLPPDPGPVTLPQQWVPPPLFGAQASLEVLSGLPQRLGEGLHSSLNRGNSDYIFCFKTFAY